MTIKKLLLGLIVAGSAVLTGNAMSAPHTWHTVRALKGTWVAKLQMLNEGGSFVARDNTRLNTFTVSPEHEQDYGFQFDTGDDFDVAYTLTLTEKSPAAMPQFTSKVCVYVVTAKGPAQPDIRIETFNGAKCDWNVVRGIGEDFLIG